MSKHPTDDIPLPEPVNKHSWGWSSYGPLNTADQLRAERIKAYDMGLEDARNRLKQRKFYEVYAALEVLK